MKKLLLFLLLTLLFPSYTFAAEDPLKVPNNKIGIHILFDHELEQAAQLVNSSGGEWGYVLIPIQIGDRDLIKWQAFMDRAKKLRVIPLIRLASEGDYFDTSVWAKPRSEDIIDFANFLDSISWPTKNRYVIIFNETNRGDEWGGKVDPENYANLLSFAVNVFKSKNQDFFIISAGMDNAAPEQYPKYMNQYTYLRKMQQAVPGIFNQIDGIASHSYPNPGFSQPPGILTGKSISSFIYERELIREYRNNDVPVFITETGWNAPGITDSVKAEYFANAFSTVWADPGIVTVAPFLLHAGDGPFKGFSFIRSDGQPSEQMNTIVKMPKVAGRPVLSPYVLGMKRQPASVNPERNFAQNSNVYNDMSLSYVAQTAFKWMMKL